MSFRTVLGKRFYVTRGIHHADTLFFKHINKRCLILPDHRKCRDTKLVYHHVAVKRDTANESGIFIKIKLAAILGPHSAQRIYQITG